MLSGLVYHASAGFHTGLLRRVRRLAMTENVVFENARYMSEYRLPKYLVIFSFTSIKQILLL
jgi:hypothetical protein